jgi:CBS domain-containing protein
MPRQAEAERDRRARVIAADGEFQPRPGSPTRQLPAHPTPPGGSPRREDLPGGRALARVGTMRARELAEALPTVGPDDEAWDAARLLAAHRLPGIAVVAPDGRPVAVLPATQVLRWVVPGYVQDDPSLARVFGEADADRMCADGLTGKRVRDLLDRKGHRVELAAVDGGATVIECAAEMARLRSPLLVVVDEGGQVHGLLTAAHLLERLLPDPLPGQPASAK